MVAVVKFVGRVVGVQVSSIEPDFVTWQIGWGRYWVVISIFALSVLGISYLSFHEVVDLSKQVSKGLCLAFQVVYLKVRFKVELGVYAIIHKEG
jgi:membrane-anchored protein YejM (alkaline phosphatase superfamily)